jgi:hypothetical protein
MHNFRIPEPVSLKQQVNTIYSERDDSVAIYI